MKMLSCNKKYITITILFYLLQTVISNLEPLPEGLASLRYSIASCVLTASNEFKEEKIITFSLSITDYKNYTNSAVVMDQILLQTFHDITKWTILVKKVSKPQIRSRFFKLTGVYIIQIRDVNEFGYMLQVLKRTMSWNPHAKFFIITTTYFIDTNLIVELIFTKLWNEKVLNAVIMLPTDRNSSSLEIYSWFPFRNGSCGDNFDKAFLINKCDHGILDKPSRIFFPDKIPKNLNNCPIKVRAIIWPPYIMEPKNFEFMKKTEVNLTKGIEVMILNTVAEAARFKPIYSVSSTKQDWGLLLRNGSATGMMKAVLNGEAHIGIGAIATLTTRHIFFDYSVAYFWESVTWCVPHAIPIRKWKCLIQIFTNSTWIVLIIAYLTVTISIWGLSNCEKNEYIFYKGSQNCFQNILSMMLGMTVTILPKITKIRLIIILWVIVSLHLNAAFTSSLIRELTQPSYETQIKTIKEMKHYDFSFGLVPPTARFFKFEGKSYYSEISTWDDCNDVKICLDRTAYNRDYGVGIPRMYMKYASHKYVTTKGHHLLYWTKEDIVGYPIEMIMIKGFPLRNRINVLISRIKEAGLIAKWQYEFMEKVDNTTIPTDYDTDTNDDVTLKIEHLEGAFILLGIGLKIALLVFIFEVISKRKNNIKCSCPKNYKNID